MFCGQCGTENPNENNFCTKCGWPLRITQDFESDSGGVLSTSLVSVIPEALKSSNVQQEQQAFRNISQDELGRFMINLSLIALGGVISAIRENAAPNVAELLSKEVKNLALGMFAKNFKMNIKKWNAIFGYMFSETQKTFSSEMDIEEKIKEIGLLLSSASCLDKDDFESGFIFAWGKRALATWRSARIGAQSVLVSTRTQPYGSEVTTRNKETVEENRNELQTESQKQCKVLLMEVAEPLLVKIDKVELPIGIRDFFKTTVDAVKECFLGVVFEAPDEFGLKKQFTKSEVDFWIRKVSLALMSFSYYYFFPARDADIDASGYQAFEMYWGATFKGYNEVFQENISMKNIDYYARGHKEICEKAYIELGQMVKTMEMAVLDYGFLGAELLETIWGEKIKFKRKRAQINANDPKAKKVFFLGEKIRKAHDRVVAYIETMLKD